MIILFMILTLPALAQSQTSHRAERKEKKTQKEQSLQANHQMLLDLTKNHQWILEANTIYDKQGMSYPVDASTNFVSAKGDEMTIQLAFPNRIGWNGLGGITVDGTVQQYDVKEVKNGINITIDMSSMPLGFSTVLINIRDDGNARATIDTVTGNQITFSGNIQDLQQSRAFKGQASY